MKKFIELTVKMGNDSQTSILINISSIISIKKDGDKCTLKISESSSTISPFESYEYIKDSLGDVL